MSIIRSDSPSQTTEPHTRLRVLFVTYYKPWPANYGTAMRVLAQLRALETIADVDLVVLGGLGSLQDDPFYRQRVVAEIPWSPGVHLPVVKSLTAKFPDGGYWLSTYLPGFPQLLRGPAKARAAFQSVLRRGYDVLYMIRPETYWYLTPQNWRPIIVDVDDVQSLYAREMLHRSSGIVKSLARRLRLANLLDAEAALFRACSACLVCSNEDAAKLEYANAVVLPNPIPEHGQYKRQVTTGYPNRLVFVGTLKYRPNREAVRFFTRQVLPHIRSQVPNASLTVIGAYRDADLASLGESAGIELLGYVDSHSLMDILEAASIVVAPLREGVGTRLKILEALSFGKPVVATHVGAYGIDLGPEDGLFREDDPKRMAELCLALMQDPTKRLQLGIQGKQRVYEIYGQGAFTARMEAILNQVVCTSRC